MGNGYAYKYYVKYISAVVRFTYMNGMCGNKSILCYHQINNIKRMLCTIKYNNYKFIKSIQSILL